MAENKMFSAIIFVDKQNLICYNGYNLNSKENFYDSKAIHQGF